MSTLKTDAITAVTADADLSLDGLGTGGVSIASTLKMTKGGDIASASPLVIDVDGNYFDVTGTTNFAAMTVEAGNFFMLQFDGALTITHGSGIELPGAANLTTATGDRLICYATAANTVEVMSVETEAAASGGSRTLVQTLTPSGASTATLTTASLFDGTYDRIEINVDGWDTSGDNVDTYLTVSDDAGVSFESAGYRYHTQQNDDSGSTYAANVSTSAANIAIANTSGNAADESIFFDIQLSQPDNTAFHKIFRFRGGGLNSNGQSTLWDGVGSWTGGTTAIDQVRFTVQSGTFSGTIRAWGVKDS